MKQPKSEFGKKVSIFLAETGMTAKELAAGADVKQTTLVAAMRGRTPGHDLVPAVCAYMDQHRNERKESAG